MHHAPDRRAGRRAVYLERATPIRGDDDYGRLSGRLAPLAADLLVEALSTRPVPRPQAEKGVT